MNDLLRAELTRIADASPPVTVDPKTWRRGRRARVRDRMISGASVLAALALGGGGLWALSPHQQPDVAGSSLALGVPSHIWAVPDRLAMHVESAYGEDTWDSRVAETDLAVGRAAAAYSVGTAGALPVVVSAKDGAYHALDLPGFSDAAMINHGLDGEVALAVSPDGRRLAYAWWDPAAQRSGPMPGGVRIVDLASGRIETIALHGGGGVDADQLVWSPSGDWLAWQGRQTRTWSTDSRSGFGPAAGRIDTQTLTNVSVPLGREDPATVAACDSGQVSIVTFTRISVWSETGGVASGRWRSLAQSNGPVYGPAHCSPDSTRVAAPTGGVSSGLPILDLARLRADIRQFPSSMGAEPSTARPLGWIDDDTVVELVGGGSDPASEAAPQLVITTPEQSATSTYQMVGSLDAEAVDSLSIATDLMSLDRSTVDRAEPEWPWSTERKLASWGLVVGAALLAGALLVIRLRHNRRVGATSTTS